MSERGSFVTQYIYCEKCFQSAKRVLLGREKDLCSTVIPQWDDSDTEIPVIAGKVGSDWIGGGLYMFEQELGPDLEALICHTVRVAVLAKDGEQIFTFTPTNAEAAPSIPEGYAIVPINPTPQMIHAMRFSTSSAPKFGEKWEEFKHEFPHFGPSLAEHAYRRAIAAAPSNPRGKP